MPVDSHRVGTSPDSERSSRNAGRSETPVLDSTVEAAPLAPATCHSHERPRAHIVPGSPFAAREIAHHQRHLGNRAAQRFVGNATITRKVASPPESAPQAAPIPVDWRPCG